MLDPLAQENLNRSLDDGAKWIRENIEQAKDVRKLALAIIALTDSGDEKFSHHIQRLSTVIKNKQDSKKGFYREGSWNGELWDTAHAIMAINRVSMDQRAAILDEKVTNGLKSIKKQWNEKTRNWWDYIPETIACSKAILEIHDEEQYEHVGKSLDWLIERKCDDGSFVSTKYTAQIISLVSLARTEMNYGNYAEEIDLAIKFVRDKINEEGFLDTSDPWVIAQIITALVDIGISRSDPDIAKCCHYLLRLQEESGNGSWENSITRTTNCLIAISKVLGPLKIGKRKEQYWKQVQPSAGRLLWSWKEPKEGQRGPGKAIVDTIKDNEIQDVVKIEQKQFDISLVDSVTTKLDKISELSTNTRAKRGNKQEVIVKEEDVEYVDVEVKKTLEEAGFLLYSNLLTILKKDESFEGKLAEQKVGHLSIQTEGSEKLNSIPWELIHDEDNFACLKYALGRKFKKIEDNDGNDEAETNEKLKILLVGDPTKSLRGVSQELETLQKNLEAKNVEIKKIYGDEVTQEKFFLEISKGDYDIIHFAGHADISEEGESSLLFAQEKDENGNTTKKITVGSQMLANQIENAKVKPKIVFMNACSSAAKANQLDTEKIEYDRDSSKIALNFVDSLSSVRVSAYIGSIWPVHDKEAANFAVDFYKNIIKGCTIGDAIRLARIEAFLKDPDELVWASFVLYVHPTMRIELAQADNEIEFENISRYSGISEDERTEEFMKKSDKALELLSDPRFEFRREQTLKKLSKMGDDEFEKFLKLYPQVIKSKLPALDGSTLYRLNKSMFKF